MQGAYKQLPHLILSESDDVSAPPAFPQSSAFHPISGPLAAASLQPVLAPSFAPGAAAAAGSGQAATYFPIVPPLGAPLAPQSWGSAASSPVSTRGYYGARAGSTYSPHGDASIPFLAPVPSGSLLTYDVMYASRTVRHGFMRKVLGIIIIQLLLTAAVAAPVVHTKQVRVFLEQNPWALVLSAVVASTVLIILACSEAARRTHPTNLILLMVFTGVEGLLVGVASGTYDTHVLLHALVMTALAMMVMVVYALQTRVEFTSEGGTLYSALTIFLAASIGRLFFRVKVLDTLIAGCGALLFSAYFIYDVQLLGCGEHFNQIISPDEYVFAALSIYTDVINLFLYILQLMQDCQPRD